MNKLREKSGKEIADKLGIGSGYDDGKVIVRGKTGLGVLGNRSMGTEMWSHA